MPALSDAPELSIGPGWRFRLPPDPQGRRDFIRALSDEYDLIEVSDRSQWQTLLAWAKIPPPADGGEPDFASGVVAGVAVRVGMPVEPGWPLAVEQVRAQDGLGWIEAEVRPGVYYPLLTHGYAVVHHLSGVRRVAAVRVNGRLFISEPVVR